MATLRRLAAGFEELVGATLLAGMCVVATIQVAGRYLLASPPAWTEELATLLFAWLVFVGAALALKQGEHFALDVLVARLPRRAQRAVQGLVLLLVLTFCGLLIGFGLRLALGAWSVSTAVMEIPRTWLYAAVPFGGVLMLVRTGEAVVRWWRRRADPAGEPDA